MSERPATTRLFLALWPEDAVRDQLVAWRDAWTWPRGASPVATPKLHLTLHFLGNLPSERLPELQEGFQVPFEPFELALGKPVLWHHGIAVLEPLSEPPELLGLHSRLSEALVRLGLEPEERKYKPHVTLARRAAGAELPAGGPAISWQARGYALIESRKDEGGAYVVLREYA
jgi:2'-5' RNA ligase